MWEELLSRVDEMFGAAVLGAVAVYAMYTGVDSGVVEMCITGAIALLVTKAARGA